MERKKVKNKIVDELDAPIKVDSGSGSLDKAMKTIAARIYYNLMLYDSVYISISNMPPEEKK